MARNKTAQQKEWSLQKVVVYDSLSKVRRHLGCKCAAMFPRAASGERELLNANVRSARAQTLLNQSA
ncbi:unnamed protein product, partial [Brenthis ino]